MESKTLAKNVSRVVKNANEAWSRALVVAKKRLDHNKGQVLWNLNGPLTRLNQRLVRLLSHLKECEAEDRASHEHQLDVDRMDGEGGPVDGSVPAPGPGRMHRQEFHRAKENNRDDQSKIAR